MLVRGACCGGSKLAQSAPSSLSLVLARRRYSATTVDRDKAVLLIWRIFHCPLPALYIVQYYTVLKQVHKHFIYKKETPNSMW